MKLIIVLLTTTILQVNASVYGQQISIKQNNVTLVQVFKEIRKQTGYDFFYSDQLIEQAHKVNLNLKNVTIEEALKVCFINQPLTYSIKNKTVTIKAKEKLFSGIIGADILISGSVKDEKGNPLEGVTIALKGTTKGVISDKQGRYSFKVPEKGILIFSLVGYVSKEIEINGQILLNVQLHEDIKAMDELVVTGYSAQKKKSITGSVSTITEEDLKNVPVTSIYEALQGMIPGLAIQNSNYQPGKNDFNVQVRGKTTGLDIGSSNPYGLTSPPSMNNFSLGNSNPLVIIDGIEGNMDLINTNDVESITVLKDASAAIYGIKAANGVILVTTKKGTTNGLNINYSNFFAVKELKRQIKYLPSWQQAVLINEALNNEPGSSGSGGVGGGVGGGIIGPGGATGGFGDQLVPISQSDIEKYKAGAPGYYNTNWEDLFYSPVSYRQKHALSISGGDAKTTFRASLGYGQDNGNVKKVSSKEYTAMLNFKSRFSSKFYISGGADFVYNPVMEPSGKGLSGVGELMAETSFLSPMIPSVFENGAPGYNRGAINPLAWLNSPSYMQTITRNGRGNLNLNWTPIKELTLNGTVGIAYGNTSRETFKSELYAYTGGPEGTSLNVIPYLSEYINKLDKLESQGASLQNSITANYDKYFGNHQITFLAGYQASSSTQNSMQGSKQGLLNDKILNFSLAPNEGQQLIGSRLETGQKSVFGKLSYNYNDIFFTDFTLRSDATSAFSPEHYWGLFPSVGAAWVVSNHSWWAENQKLKDAISYLKLRGTRGTLGNASVGYFSYLRTFQQYNYSFNQQNVPAVYPTNGYDPNITWEKTKMTNVGLDIRFLKDKMNFSFDWYHKNTVDILTSLGAPLSYGLGSVPFENVGSMVNKGFEMQLGTRGRNGDFSWALIGFFTYNQNKITKYKAINRTTSLSSSSEMVVGNEASAIYGLEADGIMQSQEEVDAAPKIAGINPANYGPGDIKYIDQNGDGLIDYKDRVKLGVNTAPVKYGLTMQGSWKRLSVSLLFHGSTGNKAYIGEALGAIGNDRGKASVYFWDRWTPENKTNTMPRAYNSYWQNNPNQVFSSFWLRDVSYVRLRTLTVTYDLPLNVCKKISAKYLKVFYSGENLATFSNFYKGLDPETSAPYVSALSFSAPVVHSFGINVQF
ncbi:TonB-dependent receptor [Pedobacter nyackensis]|uniref:TonB-linked outer membrane protein, SusC/RagA family n=1 Tax=Pedobacter nyackensis TaxID=475255 RepID=A0A1W2AP63_9SPHI|nr:TonB-dependent receptor [Pedobacter nyackensis]SMC62312.1 TonB-linked outer membrane protein, SusC/RagA family [Pedobacter nyackensis]